MPKTNYQDVYIDAKGQYFYEVSLGTDRITGKRLKKKARKAENGKKFDTAKEAYVEAIKVKNEYLQNSGYSDYNINYNQFMDNIYIPFYESEVQESTYDTRKPMLELLKKRFGKKQLREITVQDVQHFRTWLLSKNGANYSQAYASLAFGTFKRTLEFAIDMQYLSLNVANKVKAIPKGKSNVEFWTLQDFEQTISTICIDEYYEHLCFVMLWVYFNTGVRVNEGCALWWSDVNFIKKEMRINHMLLFKSKKNWKRQNYTKTEAGNRIITLDDDTVQILKDWKNRQASMCTSNFVFSYDGFPMQKSTISRIIKRYAKIAGVPEIQAKGLRHSHASYLINEINASVLVISKRLGHSSPEVTLKHYAHLWSGVDKELALNMGGRIKIRTAKNSMIGFNGNQAIKGSVARTVAKKNNTYQKC